LLAIVSSQLFEKDVLLIDYDQQRNTTSNIGSTYQITSFDRSMSAAIKKGDWVSGITQVSPHLYIMAGSPGSEELNEYLSEKYPDRRKRSLAFIKPLRSEERRVGKECKSRWIHVRLIEIYRVFVVIC